MAKKRYPQQHSIRLPVDVRKKMNPALEARVIEGLHGEAKYSARGPTNYDHIEGGHNGTRGLPPRYNSQE